jgi:hypothetical protein
VDPVVACGDAAGVGLGLGPIDGRLDPNGSGGRVGRSVGVGGRVGTGGSVGTGRSVGRGVGAVVGRAVGTGVGAGVATGVGAGVASGWTLIDTVAAPDDTRPSDT